MPRQEHLSQAGRAHARRRGVQRTRAWLAELTARAGPLLALAGLLLFWLAAPTTSEASPRFDTIEAAPAASWTDAAPPLDGWVAVQLPDLWTTRWPTHDGVTWYRLRWREPGALQPRGLFLRDMTLAGVISVNGVELARDAGLVEPLSRSWNVPRYFRLDAPVLRPGRNELLVRVSGLTNFQPGLGAVALGEPEAIHADFLRDNLVRRSLQWVSIGITAMMAVLYGMLWLMRRSEVSYGWFCLFCLLWLPFSTNYVALSPWPFDSTDIYQRVNHILLLASIGAFFMFALHFCNRNVEWLRLLAGAPLAAFVLALAVVPANALIDVRNATVIMVVGVYLCACAMIVHDAFTKRRAEAAVLALALAFTVVMAIHDTLVFLQWLPGHNYYAALASAATVIGISFALTWRLVRGLRLVEHFNQELSRRVNDAGERLAHTLRQQHDAELVQTRLTERLNLVRDLNDGLGMTLNAHINALQARPGEAGPDALSALQEVNDDLRLIIESSAFDDSDELADRILPLRHRCTRLLEAAGIECHWQFERLADCRLGTRRGLDFLRVLQEALTNVLKHSGATQVDVRIAQVGHDLRLSVRDNGRGLPREDGAAASAGMGLASMHARAARLGGSLEMRSRGGNTVLELSCPVSVETA